MNSEDWKRVAITVLAAVFAAFAIKYLKRWKVL
ncbi:hypothetical protein VMF7928_04321 [Vibrio marisflavi CECT 7928]|uniref:Uncharacterized protein n=1 Tax=Vibrio marisflavi CECT 7928 TaxID=634439 RepID=A0ABN8E959_9VIBR|nr:hypothetical protein VMF7928_04321 [Vibrio marisflavi CECT 7928]